MPFRRADYPSNWEAISQYIRFIRAHGVCEAQCADGRRCNAPHGVWITRAPTDKECWQHSTPGTPGAIRVVLTTAHLNHTPADNREENLLAMCQLHHLRYDAQHHAKNAAITRRLRRRNRLAMVNLFER